MADITLHSDNKNTVTSVSNIFIDEYMSEANGEFVKIYLYLLRLINAPDTSFSISSIADKFEHTEKDIKRALAYWERMQLLRLEYDGEQNLSGICLLDSMPKKAADSAPKAAKTADIKTAAAKTAAAYPEKKSYSPDDIMQFRQDEAIAELFFIAERYLKRTLSATDLDTLLYLYDSLHFSTDLIVYLIESCAESGHTSIHYIEKTALGWADDNIKTVEDAKQRRALRSRSHRTVMKAFGISGRALVPAEADFIQRWSCEYGFSCELMEEACKRTIAAVHQPNFKYADSILSGWHKKRVQNLSDVGKLDEEHQSRKKTASGTSANTKAASAPKNNKFNNFKQRSYDYDQLEKMLLSTNLP